MMTGRFSVDLQGQILGKTVLIRRSKWPSISFLHGIENMDTWCRQLLAKVNVYLYVNSIFMLSNAFKVMLARQVLR